jgi:hypothetical protein
MAGRDAHTGGSKKVGRLKIALESVEGFLLVFFELEHGSAIDLVRDVAKSDLLREELLVVEGATVAEDNAGAVVGREGAQDRRSQYIAAVRRVVTQYPVVEEINGNAIVCAKKGGDAVTPGRQRYAGLPQVDMAGEV